MRVPRTLTRKEVARIGQWADKGQRVCRIDRRAPASTVFKPSPEVPASAGRRATARLQQRGRSSFESRSARASSDKRLCRWRARMTGRRMCRSEQCIRRSEQCWPPITRYKLFARPDWQMLRDASGPAQAFVKIGPFSPKFLAAQRVAA